MNILHLVHQYLPEHVGGTELYTKWLAAALRQRGHHISIFHRHSAEGSGLTQRIEEGVRIWTAWAGVLTPTHRFLATFTEKTLLGMFERSVDASQPDVVHVQHLMGHPVALIRFLQGRKIPYIVTLHDFWWVCANAQLLTNYSQALCDGPEMFLNCARCALARSEHRQWTPALPLVAAPLAWRNHLLRAILGSAHRLIAPTDFVRRWYVAQGIPSDKLVTIPHGLSLAGFEAATARARPAGAVRFAYIGGLSFPKGVHLLLEAFRNLEGQVELWLAGDEAFDPDYVAQLRSLATTNVRFLGKLGRTEIWQMLAQVDVLVVPSLWYETFAFVISEAFAAGVPVIASRLGPLADRVRDEVDGLLVPPGDCAALRTAMHRLLHEPQLLSQLRTGITPINSIETHAAQIEAVYELALAERV